MHITAPAEPTLLQGKVVSPIGSAISAATKKVICKEVHDALLLCEVPREHFGSKRPGGERL